MLFNGTCPRGIRATEEGSGTGVRYGIGMLKNTDEKKSPDATRLLSLRIWRLLWEMAGTSL